LIKIIIASTIALILSGVVGHHIYLNHKVKSKINAYVLEANSLGLGKLTIGDYGIDINKNIFINDLSFVENNSQSQIKADLIITDIDLKNKKPEHLSLELKNLNYDIEKVAKYNSVISSLMKSKEFNGTINSNMKVDYKYNEKENNSFKLNFSETAQNIGSVKFSVGFENFFFNENQEIVPDKTVLTNASLEYIDDGISEELFTVMLNMQRTYKTKEDFTKHLVGFFERYKNLSKSYQPQYDEIIHFVKNKKGLKISISPQKMDINSLEMSSKKVLSNEDELFKLLNLQFKSQ